MKSDTKTLLLFTQATVQIVRLTQSDVQRRLFFVNEYFSNPGYSIQCGTTHDKKFSLKYQTISLLTLNGEAFCVPLLSCFADQSSTHNADHIVLSFKVQAVELQHIKPQVSQCNFIYFLGHFLQKTIIIVSTNDCIHS